MPSTVLRGWNSPAWKVASRGSLPWLLGMLLLALLRPALALAQSASEVQASLLSVKRLYEDFENESALKQIARAKKLPRSTDEDATLSLYEGIIQADLSRWQESAAAFKAALSQRPDAQLPVKVSPKVAQHFEKVRQAVKQELAARAPPPTVPRSHPEPKPVDSTAPAQPTASLTSTLTKAPEQRFTRPQVLIPAIMGGVLLVAGGTTWAMSRQELSRLNNDAPEITSREEAHQVASRGRTLQSVGVGLLGAGVVAVGVATGWYLFGSPSDEMALKVGTDGTSAFVQGRWP